MFGPIDVLHVDDDPSVLDLSEAFFERELDAVSMTTITDPEVALERLKTETFDCVVSDYDMPGMNGLALFEAFCEAGCSIPFVLYTGKGTEEIASEALNAGVTGYFQKGGPDQLRRLANRVAQAAEEHHTKEIADRYSTVIDALGYPVYVVDETGTFEFVNEAFADLTGYSREEIVGSPPGFIKDDEAVRESEERLGSILSSSGPDVQRFAVEITPKEGDPIPCRDHMAVLPYEGEFFDGSVGILRDISDELDRREELEAKTRELTRQNERLEEFASIVSHDLRNPLNVAQGRVELARADADDPENLEAALDAIDRMESIIDHTLTLAREGETVGNPEPVSLADVAADSWETVDTGSASLAVETDQIVMADPARLRDLFENLLSNAVEHADETVSIRVGDLEDGFYVADDGPGIESGVADSLFEPGRSGTAGNTGFGLAIVQEIATAHGWTVDTSDVEGGGARFEVRGVERVTTEMTA